MCDLCILHGDALGLASLDHLGDGVSNRDAGPFNFLLRQARSHADLQSRLRDGLPTSLFAICGARHAFQPSDEDSIGKTL